MCMLYIQLLAADYTDDKVRIQFSITQWEAGTRKSYQSDKLVTPRLTNIGLLEMYLVICLSCRAN
jgi:hypothetical protein